MRYSVFSSHSPEHGPEVRDVQVYPAGVLPNNLKHKVDIIHCVTPSANTQKASERILNQKRKDCEANKILNRKMFESHLDQRFEDIFRYIVKRI